MYKYQLGLFYKTFVCPALRFIPHGCMNQEERHISYIYIASNKDPLYNSPRKVTHVIQNSRSKGHLISFDVLISARGIRPTTGLLVDNGYRELN